MSSIVKFPFVCLAAHDWEFPRWTPGFVKLLLLPRQSRGVSRFGLGSDYSGAGSGIRKLDHSERRPRPESHIRREKGTGWRGFPHLELNIVGVVDKIQAVESFAASWGAGLYLEIG